MARSHDLGVASAGPNCERVAERSVHAGVVDGKRTFANPIGGAKRVLDREQGELLAEIKMLIEAHCPELLAEHGSAPSPPRSSSATPPPPSASPPTRASPVTPGIAPIPASSGNTQRHRLHRGGDRQLNRALHIIAFSRARTDPATRAYLDRRHSKGKSKTEAIRCFKRHLGRRIWRVLYTTEPALPAAPEPPVRTVTVGTPARMLCTR